MAPLAVAVEIRALDAVARVFRLSRAVDDRSIQLERDVPFEVGRPVAVELTLPDDPKPITGAGTVAAPDRIALARIEKRLAAYVTERMLAP